METNSGLSTGCCCLSERGRVDEKGLWGGRTRGWPAVRAHLGARDGNRAVRKRVRSECCVEFMVWGCWL